MAGSRAISATISSNICCGILISAIWNTASRPRLAALAEVAHAALNRAVREGELASAPHIALLPESEARDRVLSIAEAAASFRAAAPPHELIYLALAFGTGARPEAILRLTTFQIDTARRLINLNSPGRRTERYAKFGPDHLSEAIWAIDTCFSDLRLSFADLSEDHPINLSRSRCVLTGISKLVEPTGIEPVTSTMPLLRIGGTRGHFDEAYAPFVEKTRKSATLANPTRLLVRSNTLQFALVCFPPASPSIFRRPRQMSKLSKRTVDAIRPDPGGRERIRVGQR